MNRTPVLFLNVIVIATCGLVYELLAGTLASYVLGDSVTQFSLIIGIYLFSMGAGAWLSRFIERELALRFVEVELAVAVLGGASAPSYGLNALSAQRRRSKPMWRKMTMTGMSEMARSVRKKFSPRVTPCSTRTMSCGSAVVFQSSHCASRRIT